MKSEKFLNELNIGDRVIFPKDVKFNINYSSGKTIVMFEDDIVWTVTKKFPKSITVECSSDDFKKYESDDLESPIRNIRSNQKKYNHKVYVLC